MLLQGITKIEIFFHELNKEAEPCFKPSKPVIHCKQKLHSLAELKGSTL